MLDRIPDWLKAGATLLLGLLAGTWAGGRAAERLEGTTERTAKSMEALEPRVARLEIEAATDREVLRALKEQLSEARADIKEILRRLPK